MQASESALECHMPLPEIAIEIAAPAKAMARAATAEDPEGADVRQALLASCDAAAAKAAECVMAKTDREVAVLALVFWRGPTQIRVEVGLAGRKVPWAIRELEFSPRDPAVEKWKTVGYTVGSLASEALVAKGNPGRNDANAVPESGAATEAAGVRGDTSDTGGGDKRGAGAPGERRENDGASATAATVQEKPAQARSAAEPGLAPNARDTGAQSRPSELEARPWAIDAAVLLGPGLGPVRVGGSLRVSRSFHGPFATAASAYSYELPDSHDVSAKRFALSAGGGYEWVPARGFEIAVRGELMAEFLAAHVDEPGSGRSDGESRWSAALNLGAQVVRSLTGPVAVVLGVDATIRTNRTDITVGGANVASVPVADVTAFAGARVTLR